MNWLKHRTAQAIGVTTGCLLVVVAYLVLWVGNVCLLVVGAKFKDLCWTEASVTENLKEKKTDKKGHR